MKAKQVSFKVSKEEAELISQIANRAVDFYKKHRRDEDKTAVMMDLTACHVNGNPLRLAEMAVASDTDLMYDVGGIRANLDRNTGKLTGFFAPRFSRVRMEESGEGGE